jgi:hypothetical protein
MNNLNKKTAPFSACTNRVEQRFFLVLHCLLFPAANTNCEILAALISASMYDGQNRHSDVQVL